jgi:membrane dipeptidase
VVGMMFSRRRLIQRVPLAVLAGGFHVHVRSQEAKQLWRTGNPAIDKPREVAINLLKPTQAQIEHAWELHFGSVVFESYGFAPRCAIDAEGMNEVIKSGASAAEIATRRTSASGRSFLTLSMRPV